MNALRSTLLALLLIAPLATDAQRPEETRGSMDFEDTDIEVFIKTIAELTGKRFIYDDRVRGTVTVIAPDDVTPEEAYTIFESVLQVKGFTTVPAPGGVLKIVPVREAKQSPIQTIEADRYTPNRDLFITRLLPLKFVKADTISNTLKPLVSKDANVIAYTPTNTLIITDSAANIRRLMTIIAEIDVATYSETIKVFPIEYADAQALATQLQEIFGDQSQAEAARQPRARARRARARTEPGTEAATSVIGSVGEPRFITDERTNSIIAIATRPAIEQIGNLIELLDYQRKGTGRIHVYRLQNADAEEMADTLNSLAQGGSRAPAAPAGRATQAQAGAVAELEQGVRITADPPTNSLIIQASSEAFNTLSEVMDALDIRRPQVMVEAVIMEVDVTDNENFGAAFLYTSTLGKQDGRALAIGAENPPTGDDALDATISPTDLATFDPKTFTTAILGKTIRIPISTIDPTTGDSVTTIREVPVITGILTAAQSDNDTNIMSAPILLTADNEEAEIVVGQNIPVPTSRVQTPSGSTAGTFETSQNITRQDVGVTLRVTPQISEGDTVRLQIFQEITEVIDQDAELGPTTTNRQVENTVFVRDGEAVMIGGILSETETESVSKVPFLGDIPILGWLFKSKGSRVRKVNLLIVLTPRIVRDPEDLNRLTVEQRERFRDSAGDIMDFTEQELEARRKAVEAGVPLPADPNPVRRQLDLYTDRYPTEGLPQMRADEAARERARIEELEALKAAERAGAYVVQVAFFYDVDQAVAQLNELLAAGYDGSLLSRQEGGRPVHFVQLGPYMQEHRAQHIAREVRATMDLNAVVIIQP